MITRIEIDGFKSLRGFSMDLEPFTVLVGPNSAGKSNVLDALTLLSRLASMSVTAAFKGGRGRVLDQFTRGADGPGSAIRFAVETLTVMPPESLSKSPDVQTRLRYELVIERWQGRSGVDHLSVQSECLMAMASAEDHWVKSRPSWAHYARYGLEGARVFEQATPPMPTAKERWVVEFLGSAEPHLIDVSHTHTALAQRHLNLPAPSAAVEQILKERAAAHREDFSPELIASFLSDGSAKKPPSLVSDVGGFLKDFRSFQLDSLRLREASERVSTDDGLAPDASNLPTALAELPPPSVGALRADLVSLVPGLSSFEVVPEGESFRIDFEFAGGERLPARVVSDGTLRLLAMLTALRVEPPPSLLGIEEPENGIYPGRLRAVLELLQELSLRPERSAEEARAEAAGPRPQVVLTTHSPVLLAAMHARPECLRFLNVVRRDGRLVTHARKVAPSITPAQAREFVSLREIDRLLDSAHAEVAEAGE